MRAVGGGGVCRQERYGEGKGLEITFLGFLQKPIPSSRALPDQLASGQKEQGTLSGCRWG